VIGKNLLMTLLYYRIESDSLIKR